MLADKKIPKPPKKNGSPTIRADMRQMKRLSKNEAHRLLTHLLMMTPTDFNAYLSSPDCSMLEQIVGEIITRAMRDGDHQRLNFLFDRTIGRVPAIVAEEDETKEKRAMLEKISHDVLIGIARGKYDEAIKSEQIDVESQPIALSSSDEFPPNH